MFAWSVCLRNFFVYLQFALKTLKDIISTYPLSLNSTSFDIVVFILLSNCLGGPFGKKWTDVGAEWNERSEVHSKFRRRFIFSRMERLSSFLVIYYPIEHFYLAIFQLFLQPVHSTSNGPALSQSKCVI